MPDAEGGGWVNGRERHLFTDLPTLTELDCYFLVVIAPGWAGSAVTGKKCGRERKPLLSSGTLVSISFAGENVYNILESPMPNPYNLVH